MKINWSNQAKLDNDDNIHYLLRHWNYSVASNYRNYLKETEKLILTNPHLGQFDKKLGLHKILVVPQIYLIYELIDSEINVIRIWNNHKRPFW